VLKCMVMTFNMCGRADTMNWSWRWRKSRRRKRLRTCPRNVDLRQDWGLLTVCRRHPVRPWSHCCHRSPPCYLVDWRPSMRRSPPNSWPRPRVKNVRDSLSRLYATPAMRNNLACRWRHLYTPPWAPRKRYVLVISMPICLSVCARAIWLNVIVGLGLRKPFRPRPTLLDCRSWAYS